MFRSQGGFGSRSRAALAGSGALSHVYIQYPPLRCSVPGVVGLHYDDGNKLVLAPTSNQIFSWQVNQFMSMDFPNVVTINEGPILSIRYSLDGKIIGVQRSQQEVEFINREKSTVFSHRCKTESECILGFFWTDCPSCDIVIVKTSGLDLYSLQFELNGLKFVETKRFNVSWYVYTHESRLVLLASGMQCKTLTGFQFSAGGIIRLPKFDVTMMKAEVNKKPILCQEDVHIATMYGRIYCLQVDRVGMQLHLYRFYRDAVVHQMSCQGSLPIYSAKVAISVVDNVLLVHQVDAKVVLLYDIFADSRAPISAPLPLLVRGPTGSTINSARNKDRQSSSSSQSAETETLTTMQDSVYIDGWAFLNPDMICDNLHGLLWRIHLDLEAIAASSSEVPSLLAFLQRRRLEADKAKQLSLAVMRSIILERRALSLIANAMEILTVSYSHGMRLANYLPGAPETTAPSRAVNQQSSNSHLHESEKAFKSDVRLSENWPVTSFNGKATKVEMAPIDVEKEHVYANLITGRRESSSSSLGDADSQENLNTGVERAKPEDTAGSSATQSLIYFDIIKDNSKDDTNTSSERRASIESAKSSIRHEKSLAQSISGEIDAGGPLESVILDLDTPQTTSTMISPDEMFENVFAIVEEEMSGDPMYMVAIIVEYCRSVAVEKLKVPPGLHMLMVQLLARGERYAELGQFVSSKIVEPSKEVGMQLLEIGSCHLPTRKLGIDMLRQLSCHSEYVALLLQEGRFMEALRYIRRNKVHSISPSLFLEAAVLTKDSQKLASVLRFCTDFVPNFAQTSDYSTFSGIINEMNNAAAA
ncbi:uncharacterized protein LOC131046892 isoform X2 [Cryptomeria japonica]|uniref:uncharacterized protein LOC131046892 isoform X2 n=1 Tax=Cryptomeria japonica TaxID=3369 RepID=UPI0027DA611F|nr:uncharacterized protein LOC131046892 isoform X2 [Cryptomeria japonica]